ncbi:MAG: dTDP-4-dehydrorhamnose reductase [Bacteroidia bacterium]
MKIMLTGSNGQLGRDLHEVLVKNGYEVIALTHEDCEIADLFSMKEMILKHMPQVFINTAAFHHVELCEADAKKAFKINSEAPAFIARMCNYLSIKLIHFSSDYVFNGKSNKPYSENDIPEPLNMYGLSKLKGENLIKASCCKHLIIRVSGLYGKYPCRAKSGLNFVQLMLKLAKEKGEVKVVHDETVSPTSTRSIAQLLIEFLNKDLQGTVHLSSEGACTWYEFAEEIFNYTQTPVKLHQAQSSDFPSKVNRPSYSVLDNRYIYSKGFSKMPHWKESLHQYLDEILSVQASEIYQDADLLVS